MKAYEAAKKDIKDYQESTLSNRIATLAKSREDAISRVANLGKNEEIDNMFCINTLLSFLGSAPISLTPIKSGTVFSDSITLHSEPSFYLPSHSSRVSSATSSFLSMPMKSPMKVESRQDEKR